MSRVLALCLVLAGCATTTPPAPAAPVAVGDVVDVAGRDLRGAGVVDLASLRGRVVLVDFWASWCGPCRQALPAWDDLARRKAADGLVVLGVSVDDDLALAQAFLAEQPASFPMAWDQDQRAARRLGLAAMPTTLLVDQDGVVQWIHEGFVPGDEKEAEVRVEALLQAAVTSAVAAR